MEQELHCPICQGNKAEIAAKDIKLGGRLDDKEFLTTYLTVLRCIRCRYYMFFDKSSEFTEKDK